MLALARRGVSAFAGPSGAYQPLVWDDDAAAALVVAAATPGVVGVHDVADDEPLTRAQLAAVLADAVGRRVRRPPSRLVRLVLGPGMEFLLRSQRVSHHRFTAATGWAPRVRSAPDGIRRLAAPAPVTRAAAPAHGPGRAGTGW